jgi:hypothetical protein
MLKIIAMERYKQMAASKGNYILLQHCYKFVSKKKHCYKLLEHSDKLEFKEEDAKAGEWSICSIG